MFCWFTEAKPQPGVDNTSSYKIIRRCGPPECRFGRCRMRRAQHRCRSRTASNKRACKMQPVVIGEGGSCRGRRLSRGASDVSSAKSGTALFLRQAHVFGDAWHRVRPFLHSPKKVNGRGTLTAFGRIRVGPGVVRAGIGDQHVKTHPSIECRSRGPNLWGACRDCAVRPRAKRKTRPGDESADATRWTATRI